MIRAGIAAGVCAVVSGAAGGQVLRIAWSPSQGTAVVGDTVTWTLIAEFDGVPADRTLLAAVFDIGFEVDHNGDTGIQLSNNAFMPAFDGFFPADHGTITGDMITGASGSQVTPPLGVPDSSNPLSIYTYDMLITEGTPRSIFPGVSIVGQFTGAYEGGEFPEVFFYQDAAGMPGSVPFSSIIPLNQGLSIVPAPASGAVIAAFGVVASRRRRSGSAC
ncbi:MAG: hypothetical protein AAFY46_07240 [Planctomycetota bacterium]